MTENRIVVCFRWRGGAASADDASHYARGAGAILAHAEKLGARVIAWHAVSFAVDFPLERVEALVELIADEKSPALSFCIGVGEGPLELLGPAKGRMAFAWGEALITAWALSRIARAGEVLLDPNMGAVQSGQLLVRGARIGVLGEARLRGLKLDLRHPHQPERGFPSLGLLRAGYFGRDPVAPPPGTLGIVSGRRGIGGTRWLEELARSTKQRRILWLRPRLGESLGSLRRAFARLGDHPAELATELGPGLTASFESLAAGDGLDIDSSVELVAKVLRPIADGHTEAGLVLIDDAEHVDADSLEAVARAAQSGSFAIVARVTDGFVVPEGLKPLTRAFDVPLEPLPDLAAEQLVSEISGGRLRGGDASRWAKRGASVPLAIETALADALESGELVSNDEAQLVGGDAAAGPAGSWPSLSLLGRRTRRWGPRVRGVLGVLAILGGDSDESEIVAVLDQLRRLGENVEAGIDEDMLHALETAGLVQRERQRILLTSASLRGALTDSLSDSERARFHRAASAVLAASTLSLGSVSAAVHSMLGGDVDRALPLARRAAGALRAAGLEATAEVFEAFGETGDPDPVRVRGLFAGARTERAGLQRSDVPPPSMPAPDTHSDRPSRIPPSAEEAAQRFVHALRHGDHAAMEVLAAEIRDDGAQHVVADRLEGMASLARGQVADALRRLRGAKDRAQTLSAGDRSRAALALGVAFAAAGRGTEALLEGLEALARAREAGDAHGETACARFLARLTAAAGVSEAAQSWQLIATR